MRAEDVHRVLEWLAGAGVRAWLDGGWGVDALLGAETRRHGDLDLVVDARDVDAAAAGLAARGFAVAADERPARLAVADAEGRAVDLHPVTPAPDGSAVQRLQDGSAFVYPPGALGGRGLVGGRPVPCVSAAAQVAAHLGYPPAPKDVRDVGALCAAFGLALPTVYRAAGAAEGGRR